MTNCTKEKVLFSRLNNKVVEGEFKGGDITSDAGALLLREADRKLGLSTGIIHSIKDERDHNKCDHSILAMLRQRMYGIALGYEDLNDHITLRNDSALKTAVGVEKDLASASTLSRMENCADRQTALVIHKRIFEVFIQSYEEPPEEIVLDFDATDDPVHGDQAGSFFHGYYGRYCFLPLYVFCGEHLLVSLLRPGKGDPARHAWAVLALLAKQIRKVWPQTRIIMRADSSFCRWRMMRWCDRNEVGYILGIGKNPRLLEAGKELIDEAASRYKQTGEKQRLFGEVSYAAKPWDKTRRVLVKAEHLNKGSNPRFVVTNLEGLPQELYEMYCMRGDMENRIKEQQLDLFADRTSCSSWWPNQFRLLLSSCAYLLIDYIRRAALAGTQLASAQCGTIRLKLFKLGAVIIRNTRRIRFLFSSSYPYQSLFRSVSYKLMRE